MFITKAKKRDVRNKVWKRFNAVGVRFGLNQVDGDGVGSNQVNGARIHKGSWVRRPSRNEVGPSVRNIRPKPKGNKKTYVNGLKATNNRPKPRGITNDYLKTDSGPKRDVANISLSPTNMLNILCKEKIEEKGERRGNQRSRLEAIDHSIKVFTSRKRQLR